jgi:hypothetical protein
MRQLITSVALLSLLVSAAATAGEPAAGAAPLAGPSAVGDPPVEAGLGGVQLVVGALATFGSSVFLIWAGEQTKAAPLVLAGVAAGPGMGGWAVCALGRLSASYDGACYGTIGGSYLGALVLAIPAAIFGYYELAPPISDGGYDHTFGAFYGAAGGYLLGAAVGAVIGWHLTKQRRNQAPAKTPIPASPQTPASAPYDWSDLRPRTASRTAAATFVVPLLSLRF